MREGSIAGRAATPPSGLDEVARRIHSVLVRHDEIVCAYLFGSHVRGTAGPLSDVDVAVARQGPCEEPAEPWSTYQGNLRAELGKALDLPCDRVDLLLLDERTSPLLAHRATWLGRRVFCRDEPARIRLETNILIRFLDTAPLRAIEESQLRRALRSDHAT